MSLDGVAQLSRQLDALKSMEDGKALKRAAKAFIQPAFKIAQATIPQLKETKRGFHSTYKGNIVTKGFAKRSLRTISTYDKRTATASGVLGVRKKAYYAVNYVDKGTRYQKAQEWIVNALMTGKSAGEDRLKASLQADINKLAKTP